MSKAIKLKNNNYLDTRGIVHKKGGSYHYLNTLLDNIDNFTSKIFDKIYPVGSVYITMRIHENPSTLFGGEWIQIKDCFLWATNGPTTGTTGGSKTHSHTVNSHTHTYGIHYGMSYDNVTSAHSGETLGLYDNGSWTYNQTSAGNFSGYTAYSNQSGGSPRGTKYTTAQTGGSAPGTNSASHMPPYFEVYMWYRTA